MTASGAERERPRHVAAGIADLLGHVGRGVPARVGEHHRDQREQPRRRRPPAPRPATRFDADPAPSDKPSAMKISSAETLSAGEDVLHDAARADAADVDPRHQRRWPRSRRAPAREKVSGTNGSGMTRSGVASRAAGHEAPEIEREHDGAGRDRAGEAGDERRPAGEERGQPAERRAQVDVLAAGARPQRRQLGVRHRAGKREQRRRRPRSRGTATDSARSAATCGGVKRMPPPMTFETMMAAASSGPRRRSSVWAGRRREGGRQSACAPRYVRLVSGRPGS